VVVEMIDALEHLPAPLTLERPLLCDEMRWMYRRLISQTFDEQDLPLVAALGSENVLT
jgi:hypothetical protein